MSDHTNERVHDQDEVLASYFDDLLMMPSQESKADKQEINLKLVHSSLPSVDEMETGVQIQNTAQTAPSVEPEMIAEPLTELSNDGEEEAVVEAPAVHDETEPELAIAESVEAVIPDVVEFADGRPEWAMNSFEAVILVVNHMKFAIPKFAINGQRAFTKELKKLASQPSWVMGLKIEGDSFVAAVDTAYLLLSQPVMEIDNTTYTELVVLANSRWALAVDDVLDDVVIQSDAVNWRTDAVTRTWLCGTEMAQQYAVIEPANLFKNNE